MHAGCARRLLPHDVPPHQTVYYYLRLWQRESVWTRSHHTLIMADREREGDASPAAAAVIDSQTVRAADKRGGSEAMKPEKRMNGRKRHILTDTDGRLLAAAR